MNIRLIVFIFCWSFALAAMAQYESMHLTLEDVVKRACKESPDAQSARHSFRSSYWLYKSYKADYLPAITLSSSPNLNRAINQVTLSDGTVKFTEQNMLSTDLGLSLRQNVALTGGTFTISSSAQRLDMLGNYPRTSWQTVPVNIGYNQALFGYNNMKWNKRIEPVRYREAKKKYAEAMELVSVKAASYFFELAMAQSNLQSAKINYAQVDTLYIYAKGRYHLGTITENEMLQLELNRLTEETNCMNAQIEVDNATQKLRSYLGIQQDIDIQTKLNDTVPDMLVNIDKALQLAVENNPDIEKVQRIKLESRSAVALARANAGLKADVYMRVGLTQTADKLKSAYKNPLSQQYVTVGLSLPLLDWGRGKGQIRIARSNKDLVYTQANQTLNDFQFNVQKLVKQFNLQAQRVQLASKTKKTAQRRADVAMKLYLLGKNTILDLNNSIVEKNNAIRNHVSVLSSYWTQYYTLRSMTLYDFESSRKIEVDYNALLL